MSDIGTGFQPTAAPSVRRADIELRRRLAVLEGRVTANDARIKALEDAVSAYGLRGAHVAFTFNSATATPPIGNQLRLNNASQTAATRVYTATTTTDGMDVSHGLTNIEAGDLIYFQDFDDAAKWVRYTVSAAPTNHITWFEYPVTYQAGPANVPFQKIELMPIYPNTFPP